MTTLINCLKAICLALAVGIVAIHCGPAEREPRTDYWPGRDGGL